MSIILKSGSSGNLANIDALGNLYVLSSPAAISTVAAPWTSATVIDTAQVLLLTGGYPALIVQMNQTSTITAGQITFQGTYDGINWYSLPANFVLNPQTFGEVTNPYTLQPNTNYPILLLTGGFQQVRALLSTAITGTGQVTLYWTLLSLNPAASAGSVSISGTPTVTVAGTATVEVAGIAGTSTVEVAGIAGTPTVEIAGILGGTIAVAGTSTVEVAGIAGTPTVEVAGILGTSTVEVAGIAGTPTVEVAGILGTSTVTVAGTITAACTGTQTVEVAGIVGTSTVVVSGIVGTSTVEVAGIAGTPTVEVAGILGTSTVTVAGTVTAACTGTQTVEVAGIVGTPTVEIAGILGGTVAIAGTSTVEVAGIVGTSTVTIAGTVTAACTGTQTVTVVGTSTVEVAGIAGTPTVEVAGILGTSTVQVAGISGTPTVEVAGVLGTSTVTIAGTSTVEVAGIAGTPTVEVAGILGTSTVTVAGTITASCTGTQTVVVSGIIGTSTVEVAGIVGTSTVTVAGTVTDISDGSKLPGAAGASSILQGLVYNTATSVIAMSAGNQAAVQGDTSANLRINPYGPIGAFANVVSTGTVTATQVLTVPGSTKWAIKTLVFDAIPSNTVTKQARIWIADAAGNLMWEYGNASFTPTNTLTYRHYFLPIVVNTATYTASVAGTATQQLQAVIPELVLGPGCTINGALLGAAGTATYSLRANVHTVSD